MTYNFEFTPEKWDPSDFTQCGLYAITHRKPFEQYNDCVANGFAPKPFRPDMTKMHKRGQVVSDVLGMDHNDFAFTSMIFNKKVHLPFEVEYDCEFEGFGSPSFIYGLGTVENGDVNVFDTHVEFTIWEQGVNWWRIEHEPQNHIPELLWHDKYDLKPGRHHIKILFMQKRIEASVDGRPSSINIDLWKKGHAGFLACEDMNRFYNMTIKEL